MPKTMLSTLAWMLALSVAMPLAQRSGSVEVFEVRSRALEKNLIGDSPVRTVSVYLPPTPRYGRNRRS